MKKDSNRDPDLQFLRGVRAYFDANVFIYRVEANPRWQAVMDELWEMLEGGWLTAVTSELSLAETLVWPIKARNRDAQSEFAHLIANSPQSQIIVIPIGRDVLLEAARLRALNGIEMPDAIHAATAKIARCNHFLTADAPLAQAIGARAVNLGDWKVR